MGHYVTDLDMRLMENADGHTLLNKSGEPLYDLDSPLIFDSDVAECIITTKAGFVTDLASIPRLPLVFVLLAKYADKPGVTHDYLYSTGILPRAIADKVLREACLCVGVPAWKAAMIYWGVRIGGASHFNSNYTQ